MASPKVQLIRDFGCGLGAFSTSPAPETAGTASGGEQASQASERPAGAARTEEHQEHQEHQEHEENPTGEASTGRAATSGS